MDKTALIVEDDDNYRELLTEFLSDYDFTVSAFSSPLDCIKDNCQCPKGQPCYDIIITDNQMPGMDGIEFLDLLYHGSCDIPHKHTVLLSGYLTADIAARAKQLGSVSFSKQNAVHDLTQFIESIAV